MILLNKINKIIIHNDADRVIDKINNEWQTQQTQTSLYIYPNTNILIEDVRSIIKHSYYSSDKTEYIIIAISQISQQSQNAFLKILEEPPSGKFFIFLAQNKNIFLPTVLSRMVQIKLFKKEYIPDEFKYSILDLNISMIFNFTKDNKHIQKQEAKEIIYAMLNQAYINNIPLSEKILEQFSSSLYMINLNTKPVLVLSNILLNIFESNVKSTPLS